MDSASTNPPDKPVISTAQVRGAGAGTADVTDLAAAVRVTVGLLRRRMRLVRTQDDLTLPESAALAHLDRGGPATPSALARLEQISPQSMGVTLAGLEARGLVRRSSDPQDGRRCVMSLTASGLAILRGKRDARTRQLAAALAASFSAAELDQLRAAVPLLERLAQSI
jgi:DNA-binding MarR family transcriptional regulator